MVRLTDVDLDLVKRLKDDEFAREYVAMVEYDAAKQADRIEVLEFKINALQTQLASWNIVPVVK